MERMEEFKKSETQEVQSVVTAAYTNVSNDRSTKSKAKKTGTAQRVVLNISKSGGAEYALEKVIADNAGWKTTLSLDCDIWYLTCNQMYEEQIYQQLLQNKKIMVNRYPNIKTISRKDNF